MPGENGERMKRFKIDLWVVTSFLVAAMVFQLYLILWPWWVALPVTVWFWQSILWPCVEKVQSTYTLEVWRVVWERPAEQNKYREYFDHISSIQEVGQMERDLHDDEDKRHD